MDYPSHKMFDFFLDESSYNQALKGKLCSSLIIVSVVIFIYYRIIIGRWSILFCASGRAQKKIESAQLYKSNTDQVDFESEIGQSTPVKSNNFYNVIIFIIYAFL